LKGKKVLVTGGAGFARAQRSETVGSNVLSGADSNRIVECTKMMILRENSWKNPFGDGNAGRKTVETLRGIDLFWNLISQVC
jgi:UDP-N-acetylglucosamine 2-epimerase